MVRKFQGTVPSPQCLFCDLKSPQCLPLGLIWKTLWSTQWPYLWCRPCHVSQELLWQNSQISSWTLFLWYELQTLWFNFWSKEKFSKIRHQWIESFSALLAQSLHLIHRIRELNEVSNSNQLQVFRNCTGQSSHKVALWCLLQTSINRSTNRLLQRTLVFGLRTRRTLETKNLSQRSMPQKKWLLFLKY